jgi:ElaB/YqjD/DUF883 family membrane-anchored ribosome-binding protein
MNTESKAGHDAMRAGAAAVNDYDSSRAKLMADLKLVVADARTLLKEAADCPADGFAALRTRFEKKLLEAKEQVGRAKIAVDEKAHRASAAARAYVKANPWQSAGIFVAAGLIFGALIGSLQANSDRQDEIRK